jgi:hypothetical protein
MLGLQQIVEQPAAHVFSMIERESQTVVSGFPAPTQPTILLATIADAQMHIGSDLAVLPKKRLSSVEVRRSKGPSFAPSHSACRR